MCLRSVFLIPRFIHRLFVKNHSYSCKSNTTFNKVGMASEPPKKKTKTKDTTALEAESGDNEFCQNIKSLRLNTASSITNFKFNKKRARVLSEVEEFEDDCGGIVYWMSRDQRVQDNWAFLYAQRLAMKLECPLHVCFCLVPKFLEATIRQFGFMLKGLEEVEKECTELGIPFHLLIGYAKNVLPEFVEENDISGVVTDFSPLRVPMKWAEELKAALPKNVPLCQVDAHNVVPVWQASPKQEYSARTIRNKIHNQLKEYFTEFPPVIKHPYPAKTPAKPVDWVAAEASLEVDRTVEEVDWAKPGTTGGLLMLESFIKKRLSIFNKDRNNPNKQALSNMSPWYHFGQVSVQRAMLMVNPLRNRFKESVDGYIEEGIIRRELADNFCFYNSNYDNIQGAHEWAQKTLKDHWKDKREKVYTQQQLEEGKTHDDLWNGAQTQMVCEGKMHGFLRMYWAKKILEWTENPDEALRISLYLNDKYQLDGRDPSGYVGCMWSICGTHDQGWAERAVFGKIRYMNYQGCKRKFDVSSFEMKYRAKARAMKR